ncbi:neuropeptide receptor 22-like isoform X1 [Watersipora subatra]|uniref:neuropeptide receptor 22-like isoform X1 n=1 Tax=Watersipora subatra TaxID=2589382 RepID=UPI00355BC0ED
MMPSSTLNDTFENEQTFLLEKELDSELPTNLSSNTSEHECGCYSFTETEFRVITGTLILQSTLGVVLNIIAILTIGFGKKTGKKVKLQLINLAVADCLMALFVVPGYNHYSDSFLSTSLQCKLYFFTYFATLHAGLICNAVISVERAFIVLFPLYEKRYRRKHKICLIVFIWLCTTLPEIEELLYKEFVMIHEGYSRCARVDLIQKKSSFLLVWFAIPVSVIFISYTAIFVKLLLRRQSGIVRNSSSEQTSSHQQVLIMLAADALLTLLTWLPLNILTSFDSPVLDGIDSRTYTIIDATLYSLMGTNAFSTPVVYFIFSKNFRHDVTLLCKRTLVKTKSIKHERRAELKDSEEAVSPSSQSTGLSDKAV